MRSPSLVVAMLAVLATAAVAGPIEDLEQEKATLDGRLIELTMSSLEARFAKPGGPILKLYDVADLTVRLTDFLRPNIAVKPAGSEFDEDQPQFGTSREGPTFFGPDELTELLSSNVRPAIWEGDAFLRVQGTSLVVSAPADVQDEIRVALDALRANLGRLVTVEVRALEIPLASMPTGLLTSAECDALLDRLGRGEGGTILGSVEVTGYAGQRLMVFDGTQQAFVQDHDVEVAQRARIADPIVAILQEGLSVDVRGLPQGTGQGILLDVQADFTVPGGELRTLETAVGPVQLPRQRHARAAATVTIIDGGGLLFGGTSSDGKSGGRIAFLARARVTSMSADGEMPQADREAELRREIAATRRLIAAYEEASKDRGPLFRMHLYPVEDLVFALRDYPGPSLGLIPSGAGGFMDDEDLGEDPVEFFEPDQLVEMIRSHVAPGSWDELLSTNIEFTERNLVAVHTAGAHARISEFLRRLREHAGRMIALDVEVVSLTDADRRALGGTGPVLSPKSMETLRGWIATGRAQRLHAGRILARSDQRVALVDLEPVSYVYDYDVEIADTSSIADPLVNVIRQGLVVDVRPVVAGRGSHVVLECRMSRAVLAAGEIPQFESGIGAIEEPKLDLIRLGCTLSIPTGSTAIVGGSIGVCAEGGVPHGILLLTPKILNASNR